MSESNCWSTGRARAVLVLFYLFLAAGLLRYWALERPIFPGTPGQYAKWPPAGSLVDASRLGDRGMAVFTPGTPVAHVVESFGLPLLLYGSMHSIPPYGVLTSGTGGWTVRPMTQKERYIWGLPMDANACDPGDLLLIPTIGPALAERIHRFIRDRWGIDTLKELDGVKGVGAARLKVLRQYLTTGRSRWREDA